MTTQSEDDRASDFARVADDGVDRRHDLQLNLSSTRKFLVEAADTATALGSGSLEVLGTPRLLAWFEALSVSLLREFLADECTSVGVKVAIEHLAPTAVGREVVVKVTLQRISGRRCYFTGSVSSEASRTIATVTLERAIVLVDTFMKRLS